MFIIRCVKKLNFFLQIKYKKKKYYLPLPLGVTETEKDEFKKRKEEIGVNIWQIIRDYIELRENEFLQESLTSLLLLKFFK